MPYAKRTTRVVMVAAVSAVAALLALASWRLFGEEHVSVAPLGDLALKRSWGRVVEIRYDHDADGTVDAVETYPGGANLLANHQQPTTLTVDADGDGVLDTQFEYRPAEGVVAARRDRNGDGTFEEQLPLSEARDLEKKLRRRIVDG